MASNPNRTDSAESREASPEEPAPDGASKSSSEKAKQPSKLKHIWTKTGLDKGTCLIMAKGGIPPVVALAICQADAVANHFGTLGYLVAIVSVLGFCIMPRAKFVQTLFLNILSICLSTAVQLLAIYCAVMARQHTGTTSGPSSVGVPTPGTSTAAYNSSASAVSAIWLFAQIYMITTLRAKLPQFQFPAIIYCIFVFTATTFAPTFSNMAAGMNFARKLFEAFLAGLAIAAVVSFLIVPMNSRQVVFKEMTGYFQTLRKVWKVEVAYLQNLEDSEAFTEAASTGKKGKKAETPQAAAVKKAVASIGELSGKLNGDLPFAKREVAFGNLGPDEIQELSRLIRGVMLPTVGLSSVIDIFERLGELDYWNRKAETAAGDADPQEKQKRAIHEWNDIMKAVHEPFSSITQVLDEGILHAMLCLKLQKPAKQKEGNNVQDGFGAGADDVEARGEDSQPGGKGFAEYLDRKSQEFYHGKEMVLQTWCERKGIRLAPDFFDHPADALYSTASMERVMTEGTHARNQRQLYLLLYMEFLFYSISQSVLALVRFADAKVADGTMSKTRLIVPGLIRMKKWIKSMYKVEDTSDGDDRVMSDVDGAGNTLYLGEAYRIRKDPEHLPPANVFEKLGNGVRAIPRFLRSNESVFGFRAACATMSIGIIAFLADTQRFFIQQRLLWSLFMVAISMNVTAGFSIFSFALRLVGTVVAMVFAFFIYYIPNRNVVGILVLLWLFAGVGFYFVVKYPRFIIAALIGVVTTTLIIGYELEVRKIGTAAATSNGQGYLPVYLFGPYRLATVAGGLAVAFFWTIFPYPVSENSELRRNLGASLYLLANYYSIVHETVHGRIRGDEGNMLLKTSPGRRLEKARIKVFTKQTMLLNGLRQASAMSRWQVQIGGRFPKETYDALIQCIQNVHNYMSLIAFASATFANPKDESESAWLSNFRRLISSANFTSHEITSLLSLLSHSIGSGQPLPPYLKAPQPFQLSARLEAMDKDILSVRHYAEPGHVKSLVGELDFSFHIVSTASSSNASSETLLSNGGDREKND
ncbi:hypothetical protein H2201_006786 [Coniosporium apollinis]|uniref:ER transporter 6TM N-terminal domain-containing protein n=1 Tax=Coniosporium apollinis TaxID=61459 RepID=A0ABQ9NKQ8_9PEZI|nr:hypothetical protein H2201_006786 [Coniosporium apollinis]